MTKPLTQQQRTTKTRQSLIFATRAVIRDQGIMAASSRNISTAAETSTGSITYTFKSIDNLILEANTQTLSEMGQYMFWKVRKKDRAGSKEKLIALALAYFDYAIENKNLWEALFYKQYNFSNESTERYLISRLSLIEQIATLFGPDMKIPNNNKLELARTLYEAIHGIVILNLTHNLGGTHDDARTRIRLLLNMLSVWTAEEHKSQQ